LKIVQFVSMEVTVSLLYYSEVSSVKPFSCYS
jgi:hypothetical protein